MENSEVIKGDEVIVVESNTLPENWEIYIGDTFKVRDVSGAGEIFITLPNGNEMVLIEGEFELVENYYQRQKSKLNV